MGHVACLGEMRNVYRIFLRNPERERPLHNHMCRREGNVKKELGYEMWTEFVWFKIGTSAGLCEHKQ
jgi:hypothetical protein